MKWFRRGKCPNVGLHGKQIKNGKLTYQKKKILSAKKKKLNKLWWKLCSVLCSKSGFCGVSFFLQVVHRATFLQHLLGPWSCQPPSCFSTIRKYLEISLFGLRENGRWRCTCFKKNQWATKTCRIEWNLLSVFPPLLHSAALLWTFMLAPVCPDSDFYIWLGCRCDRRKVTKVFALS